MLAVLKHSSQKQLKESSNYQSYILAETKWLNINQCWWASAQNEISLNNMALQPTVPCGF